MLGRGVGRAVALVEAGVGGPGVRIELGPNWPGPAYPGGLGPASLWNVGGRAEGWGKGRGVALNEISGVGQ